MRLILTVIIKFYNMEAETKQVIKEKEYVHDESHDKYASKGLAGM